MYYHVATETYPDRDVTASILYTETGTRRSVDPLTLAELRSLVEGIDGSPDGSVERDLD